MSTSDAAVRLTELSHGAGCACKLSLDELTSVLDGVPWVDHPDLVVGTRTGDDAAVWRQPDGTVLVATTDFFTPLVDDPTSWGRIAAANAVSDVYAMGAVPLFALNLVGWPRDLPFALLQEVLTGAAKMAAEAGYPIAGGHSIDSREPLFGQVVLGTAAEGDVLTNAGARPGQVVVLTKAIGTGIITTALKRSSTEAAERDDTPLGIAYEAALASMTRLNAEAARTANAVEATAATDITGFGLLGHLHRLAAASDVQIAVEPARVPLLPHVRDLLDADFVPGGTQRNIDQSARFVRGSTDDRWLTLLCDAQTSGGLVFTCQPDRAEAAVRTLQRSGHATAVIGEVRDGEAGTIHL